MGNLIQNKRVKGKMMDDDMEGELNDNMLVEFQNYEQYLDSMMTPEDLFYLED